VYWVKWKENEEELCVVSHVFFKIKGILYYLSFTYLLSARECK
jgi:hypothetical protein